MTRTLDYPLYADKPKRHLPNSDVIVVTMYRSKDGGVRECDLFTDDDAYLGRAYFQARTRIRPACYTMDQFATHRSERFQNLAAFAAEMKRRHGIEVK